MTQRCDKCGSDKIIPNAEVLDHSHTNIYNLSVAVNEDPNALFFKGRHTGTLYATICASCGHTELKATNLRELWDVYQQSLGR
ncbi:MAG TPA: hypothetical protein VGE07_14955 [Herpetosiphonaceae bacterium]